MAPTVASSGSPTATAGGTEDFLYSPSTPGTYTLAVDFVNMAAGDVVELRAYMMVVTGGTARVVYYNRWNGAQAINDRIKVSVPVSTGLSETNALRFSLTQVLGTARVFPWNVLKY